MLLSACETERSSVVVTPRLQSYSPEFQDLLADELDAQADPCGRLDPQPGCSASARFTLDHINLRDRVRALRGEQSE